MIVCRECGEHQAEGTVFCGRCGSFLEWEGERVETPASKQAAAPPADEPAAALDTDSAAGSVRESASESPAEPSGPPVAEKPTEPVAFSRQPQQGHRPVRTPAPRRLDRLPSGSLVCGQCGSGNDPSRRFCSRCGTSLADAAVSDRPAWWRRLLFAERTYRAGDRRRPRHRVRTAVRLSLLALVLAAVVALVGPLRPSLVRLYRDITGQLHTPEQVRAEVTTASGAVAGHPAKLAFDGAKNTYWAAPRRGVPYLRAQLAQPVHLVDIGITAGVSTNTPKFLAAARPKIIQLDAFTGEGIRSTRLDLQDKPGFQKFAFDVSGVRALRFRVVASSGSTPTESTAVTEVELFARE